MKDWITIKSWCQPCTEKSIKPGDQKDVLGGKASLEPTSGKKNKCINQTIQRVRYIYIKRERLTVREREGGSIKNASIYRTAGIDQKQTTL